MLIKVTLSGDEMDGVENHLNADHITAFGPNTEGGSWVRMTNAGPFNIKEPVKDLVLAFENGWQRGPLGCICEHLDRLVTVTQGR